MKNELQFFNNEEFGQIRCMEIDGKPYFVASDIAKALGYANPSKAINDHCKGVTKRYTLTNGGKQQQYNGKGEKFFKNSEGRCSDDLITTQKWVVFSLRNEITS